MEDSPLHIERVLDCLHDHRLAMLDDVELCVIESALALFQAVHNHAEADDAPYQRIVMGLRQEIERALETRRTKG